jgi:hypothetical protein
MQQYSHSIEITHQQYEAGEWVNWMDELAARDGALPPLQTNGVDVAAARLSQLADA